MKRLNKKIENSKIIEKVKVILFISLLISTYFISTKTIDFLIELDVELLKRSFNIILVALVMFLYKKN